MSSSIKKSPPIRKILFQPREHFVKLASFLNCNKVKKLGVTTIKQIIEGIEGSESLELN